MQYQKFKNLTSGPIIFQNGETFVPDYSCEKAIKLTVDILNLKNNKSRKLLKDEHEY
jgi:hypothetical protein